MKTYIYRVSAYFTSMVEADSEVEARDRAIAEMDFETGWGYAVECLESIEGDDDEED